MKTILWSLLVIWSVPPAAAAVAQNWLVRIGEDGLRSGAGCLLESASLQVHDGQTTTPIKLVYNGEVIIGMTESNIDLSYSGIGLRVDGQAAHSVDAVHKKTNVIFRQASARILPELIKGKQATLVLGFWPTWPKTKTVASRFSLRGFSRAYRDFQYCRKTGDLKK